MLYDTQIRIILDERIQLLKLKKEVLIQRLPNKLETANEIILFASIMYLLDWLEQIEKGKWG